MNLEQKSMALVASGVRDKRQKIEWVWGWGWRQPRRNPAQQSVQARLAEEETARKRRETEEAKRGDHEHADGDRDNHEHADGDRDDHHAARRAFLRDDASACEGRQQESASADHERARKDTAPHAQEPSSETMGGAEVPERGMDQVALV